MLKDDPSFVESEVQYFGQTISRWPQRLMQRRATLSARESKAVPSARDLDIRAALAAESYVLPTAKLVRGDPDAVLERAAHRLQGSVTIGGQDHFYLEGQIAVALPQEDGAFLIHSSTQHPTEVQSMVAHALGVPANLVTVHCRRMGGGLAGRRPRRL
jgi:xanthine dehydrogenase large subunit